MKNRLYLPLILSIVTLAAACSSSSSEAGDSGNDAAVDALVDLVADVLPGDSIPDRTELPGDIAPDLVADAAPDTTVDVAHHETGDDTTMDILPDICLPDCDGKVCGGDGCGGSCGDCMNWCDPYCDQPEVPYSDPSLCMQGGTVCAQVCCPNCCDKQCGNDGCGGLCGQCEGPQEMCDQGQCTCQPLCDGVECGDDGCGGSCGVCADGWLCSPQGLCELPCVPEGGTLVPDGEASCCNGLVAVSFCHPVETGSDCDGSCPCHEDSCVCSDSGTAGVGEGAAEVPAPQYDCSGCSLAVCTACGDGECGPGENPCNCYPDCGYPACWEEYLHPDSDGDGVPDVVDVCPWIPDPWQMDFDLDSLGDTCDPDDDDDGTTDAADCKPFDPGIPACDGKQCGDDGCGGSCGACDAGWLCSPQGLCEL